MGSHNPSCSRQEVQLASVSYPAPDFTLQSAPGELWTLSKTNGKPRVIVFYPADFSPVCGDQLALYNEIIDEFTRYNAQLIGISVDGPWCHRAYAANQNLEFPLLADFHPKGQISELYGVYREKDGVSERAIFVIDAEGIIRWKYISPIEVNPGAEGILSALETLAPVAS
jgi:peroxiredoxin